MWSRWIIYRYREVNIMNHEIEIDNEQEQENNINIVFDYLFKKVKTENRSSVQQAYKALGLEEGKSALVQKILLKLEVESVESVESDEEGDETEYRTFDAMVFTDANALFPELVIRFAAHATEAQQAQLVTLIQKLVLEANYVSHKANKALKTCKDIVTSGLTQNQDVIIIDFVKAFKRIQHVQALIQDSDLKEEYAKHDTACETYNDILGEYTMEPGELAVNKPGFHTYFMTLEQDERNKNRAFQYEPHSSYHRKQQHFNMLMLALAFGDAGEAIELFKRDKVYEDLESLPKRAVRATKRSDYIKGVKDLLEKHNPEDLAKAANWYIETMQEKGKEKIINNKLPHIDLECGHASFIYFVLNMMQDESVATAVQDHSNYTLHALVYAYQLHRVIEREDNPSFPLFRLSTKEFALVQKNEDERRKACLMAFKYETLQDFRTAARKACDEHGISPFDGYEVELAGGVQEDTILNPIQEQYFKNYNRHDQEFQVLKQINTPAVKPLVTDELKQTAKKAKTSLTGFFGNIKEKVEETVEGITNNNNLGSF